MTFRRPVLAVLAAALALPVYAQQLKPGLWEMSNHVADSTGRMDSAMAEMQKQLAQMPPDQRKMMEQMMAKHGVQLSSADGGAMLAKMCLTPEMVKNNELPMRQQGNCTHQRSPVSGGKMKFSFSCSDPKTSGEGEITFHGDSSYTMKARVAQGGGDMMTVDSSARWLGADCGDVKPLAMPK
ncbi:MAG: DUF3617 domain-containing protein [Telluria sp.]